MGMFTPGELGHFLNSNGRRTTSKNGKPPFPSNFDSNLCFSGWPLPSRWYYIPNIIQTPADVFVVTIFFNKRRSTSKGNSLLLVGPPDGGKTTILSQVSFGFNRRFHTSQVKLVSLWPGVTSSDVNANKCVCYDIIFE